MAYENVRTTSQTPTASENVRSKRFLTFNGATVQEVSTNGGNSIGVSTEASAVDSSTVIAVALLDGALVEVTAGASVTAGVAIMSDNQGRAIPSTGANSRVLGIATNSATVGTVVSVLTGSAGRQGS